MIFARSKGTKTRFTASLAQAQTGTPGHSGDAERVGDEERGAEGSDEGGGGAAGDAGDAAASAGISPVSSAASGKLSR